MVGSQSTLAERVFLGAGVPEVTGALPAPRTPTKSLTGNVESFGIACPSTGRFLPAGIRHGGASAILPLPRLLTLPDAWHQAPHSEPAADKPSETKAFPQPSSAPLTCRPYGNAPALSTGARTQ